MRKAYITRKTKETDIKINLEIDGKGKYNISTTIPFFDHMLELFARHGLFNLSLKAIGDTEVDYHHTVEDIGISLGQAFKKTLKNRMGIVRYGSSLIPMDDALASVAIDFGGRPYLVYNVKTKRNKIGRFDLNLIETFFHAFVNNCGCNIHINLSYGKDPHHIIESIFKGFGRALDQATSIDRRVKGVPSTKGK